MDFKLSSRCSHCRKKSHIIVTCSSCGKDVCILHRAPESHGCSEKQNNKKLDLVKCVPKKLDKI